MWAPLDLPGAALLRQASAVLQQDVVRLEGPEGIVDPVRPLRLQPGVTLWAVGSNRSGAARKPPVQALTSFRYYAHRSHLSWLEPCEGL